MLHKGFTRIRELGDSLYDGKLTSIIFPININGVHWTVFLVDVKNREIRYGDLLDWPWPRADVDSIQCWLCEHGFRPFSKGAVLPHGCQEDAYSCAIAMINIIHHQHFNTPLFMDEKKDLFCIQELILILHAHFSEDDDMCMSDYSPSSPCSSLATLPNSRSPSPAPLAPGSPPPLAQRQMLMCQQLKQSAQSVHDAQVHSNDDPDTSALQPSQSLAELSRPHCSIKEELHRVKKPS
ncbi:hypothetical protein P692DRAFT_20756362, partial [Suillus brevipes Sb2]